MNRIAFLDLETDSLRADCSIWEIGVITRDTRQLDTGHEARSITEHRWLLPIRDTSRSDPMSLDVGRYHQRHPYGNNYDQDDSDEDAWAPGEEIVWPPMAAAREVAKLTHGATLAGISVDFDASRLTRLMTSVGVSPSWNYLLCDVRTLMAGRLQAPLPWETEALGERFGVEPPSDAERHTALGDARWAARLLDAVYTVHRGVRWDGDIQRWRAHSEHEGVRWAIGAFETLPDAVAAREEWDAERTRTTPDPNDYEAQGEGGG